MVASSVRFRPSCRERGINLTVVNCFFWGGEVGKGKGLRVSIFLPDGWDLLSKGWGVFFLKVWWIVVRRGEVLVMGKKEGK